MGQKIQVMREKAMEMVVVMEAVKKVVRDLRAMVA
jgi:hypothetical protein